MRVYRDEPDDGLPSTIDADEEAAVVASDASPPVPRRYKIWTFCPMRIYLLLQPARERIRRSVDDGDDRDADAVIRELSAVGAGAVGGEGEGR